MTPAVAMALMGCLSSGCSTMANIERRNGPPVRARIVRSDANDVIIRTEGGEHRVARNTITNIDHPGNVAAIIGSILSVYGVMNIAAGAGTCGRQPPGTCTGVFLPAGVGVPVALWGWVAWTGSRRAARAAGPVEGAKPPPAMPRILFTPQVQVTDNQRFYGASLTGRF